MTHQTKIEWCDFTVNFWEGCQKVGPGCDHCYAEARDQRFTGGQHWGPHAPRRKVKGGIKKLIDIQANAEQFKHDNGYWPRVFCSSLSDVFDNAVDPKWRLEAFREIQVANKTRVILLTKRVGNVFQMIPPGWASPELGGWPNHVGLMITVVNQEEADRDIPKLLDLKARHGIPWVGLSMEPLLGTVDLNGLRFHGQSNFSALGPGYLFADGPFVDWVIVGGESGRNSRPMHPDWARSLRDQCVAAEVAFLFKQWGEHQPREKCLPIEDDDITVWPDGAVGAGSANHHGGPGWPVKRIGKSRAGRLLDGRTWDQFPEAMEW